MNLCVSERVRDRSRNLKEMAYQAEGKDGVAMP